MDLVLAIDFGSTYTKAVAFDLTKEEVVEVVQTESTVEEDITVGLNTVLEELRRTVDVSKVMKNRRVLACSSAAGGLRVVTIGLVKSLTTKAAEECALGAGGKIVGTFSYGMNSDDIRRVETLMPDLVLLVGGTDGGDSKNIIHNAIRLANSKLECPIVVAGNKMAAGECRSILCEGGKNVRVEKNLLPEIDSLCVEPVRETIRRVFMRQITRAKGLNKVQNVAGNIIMPTPLAVMKGAILLAEGFGNEKGVGELVAVDVGGATTDIHSIGKGEPTLPDTIVKGLREPYAKRTVEGDLGLRYNAEQIFRVAKEEEKKEVVLALGGNFSGEIDLAQAVRHLSQHKGFVPRNSSEHLIDIWLARTAVKIAISRHAGRVEEVYYPAGKVRIQYGKDLTGMKSIVGTGGIFAYGKEPHQVLEAALCGSTLPGLLAPISPEILVDKRYILFAVGLLAEHFPEKALRIIKKYLRGI